MYLNQSITNWVNKEALSPTDICNVFKHY